MLVDSRTGRSRNRADVGNACGPSSAEHVKRTWEYWCLDCSCTTCALFIYMSYD